MNSPRKSALAAVFYSLLATAVYGAPDPTVMNEAGSLRFSLLNNGPAVAYRVDRVDRGQVTTVIDRSPLGLVRTDADFAEKLTFEAATAASFVEDNYTLATGKQRYVYRRGVERRFTFHNEKKLRLDLVVRAYADGVAFRYELPGHGTQLLYVVAEKTGFALPPGGRVWVQPYSKVDVWAPAYESDYVNGVPVGTAAPGPEGWALPLLCGAGNLWTLITESGLEPSYHAMHLEPQAENGVYRVRPPEEPETYGVAPQTVAIALPWQSPWRVIVVSDRAGGIAESTLVTDVARPSELADTSWILPGLASWSWWSDMASPRDYAKLTRFVDVAAKFRWRYSLLDLGWDEMANGGDIAKLAAYAASKGVALTVWYNSAGRHNRVPDAGPRDLLNDPLLRDAEFARIAALGIKGVKIDFMQSDKQFVVALYHDILRDAAKHRLVVDFHGCTIPRGWQRTYPNLVTMEAVRGAEQYGDHAFAEKAALLNTIYVFTRNAVGPMDYTPTVFANPTPSYEQRVPHRTTNAHELALPIVFESGITHIVDPPPSLLALPDFVQDYLTALPAAWSETRVLAGEPGDFAVIARRADRTWYIAGINGRPLARSIAFPLSFLDGHRYELSLIGDGPTAAEFTHTTRMVGRADTLSAVLAAQGGFAARLRPSE